MTDDEDRCSEVLDLFDARNQIERLRTSGQGERPFQQPLTVRQLSVIRQPDHLPRDLVQPDGTLTALPPMPTLPAPEQSHDHLGVLRQCAGEHIIVDDVIILTANGLKRPMGQEATV
jgi:hypothetical protein